MNLRAAWRQLNEALAARVTRAVGTMTCAWIFAALALWGLPAALRPGGVGLIAWIAQEFLQLVLLSILAVGQQVQQQQATEHERAIAGVHDRLDAHAERLDAIHENTTRKPPTGRQRKESAP